MLRVITSHDKLSPKLLELLAIKYPDGYCDSDIIKFRNQKDQEVQAVEFRTEDTIFFVKVSEQLQDKISKLEYNDLDLDDDSTFPEDENNEYFEND